MTLHRQADSSSESSSGSSSDSSSSGSSSSSSDSGSTSSDTDSSASESQEKRTSAPSPSQSAPPVSVASSSSSAPTATSSTSSSSSTPATSTSNVAAAAQTAPAKAPDPPDPPPGQGASSGGAPKPASSTNKSHTDKPSNSKSHADKPASAKPVSKKSSISSSEEDVRIKTSEPKQPPPRRRSSVANKPKNTTPANSRQSRVGAKPNSSKPASKAPPSKPLTNAVSQKADSKKPLKKKSIFSPDNSSESEPERSQPPSKTSKTPPKLPASTSQAKQKGRKTKSSTSSNEKSKSETAADSKSKESQTASRQKRGSISKKPPSVKKKPEKDKKFQSKAIVSSCSSTNTESTGSVSSSDSESSVESAKVRPPVTAPPPPAPKKAAVVVAKLGRAKTSKPEPVKTDKNTPKENPVPPCTDSDVENTKPTNNTANITRKLTRSASARKSIHVIGKTTNSDSDSDVEIGPSKRSVSKSPVKRATVSSKGPPALLCPVKGRSGGLPGPLPGIATGAIPRTGQPTAPSSPRAALPEREQELRCLLPGCDSLGHLSGRLDRHFTIEACPMYHNTTADECRERAATTRANQESRRRALRALEARRTSQPSIEHRAYQLNVKEMRSKWKPPSSSTGEKDVKEEGAVKTSSTWSAQQEAERAGEREPILSGFVPDYDLNLFREAQAAAALKIEEELKNMPPSKGTRYVCMGKYCMEAWYQSPYPPDAARLPQLYLCEFCLNHHKTVTGITRHKAKCVWKHPPGDEVYRKGNLGVWQVDGRRHKQYCQQLCLLAKFFLDHKTLYYDVEPFLFYVMTLADSEGCHTVGYFSKEKNSLQNYNVSCILTLPPYQRQGYGRLLIDFSYLLTRVEGKIGSPEKPLSDLGLISYRSYWKDVLLQYLCAHPGSTLSIRDLSQEMAINSYDIVSTLQALGMMKYWKGKHIILKKQDVLDEYMERVKRRGHVKQIDPTCLKWSPFVPPTSQSGG